MEQELHPSKGKRCDVYVSAEYRLQTTQLPNLLGKGNMWPAKSRVLGKSLCWYSQTSFLCVLPVPRSYAYKSIIK